MMLRSYIYSNFHIRFVIENSINQTLLGRNIKTYVETVSKSINEYEILSITSRTTMKLIILYVYILAYIHQCTNEASSLIDETVILYVDSKNYFYF